MRLIALLALLMLCSCGGKAKTNEPGAAGEFGGGGLGSAGEPSVSPFAGVPPSMCADDWDCEGHPCVEIYPDHKSCVIAASEVGECDSDEDECCSSSDCAQGKCYRVRSSRSRRCDLEYHNACASDECTAGSCGPEGACMPAGVLGPVATCTNAACQTDGDCSAETGGRCLLIGDPCCNGRHLGLLCWYPSRGCWYNGSCSTGEYCGIAANGRDTECQPRSLVCPD